MDTSVVPLGEFVQRTIVRHVVEVGDEAESRSLEAKSDLDLTSRSGIAKLAKFLLGAANRLPRDAMRQFAGHAVLVIGAAKGSAVGVPRGIEPHDLEDRLRPYLGSAFPAFELGRVPVDDDREVLLVIGMPPRDGQPIYPCHKDFQGANPRDSLEDGAVYVRAASNTRKARAGEIVALVERGRSTTPPEVALDIDVAGPIGRLAHVGDLMEELFDAVEQDFNESSTSATATRSLTGIAVPGFPGGPVPLQRRSERLERWRRDRAENLRRGREHFLGVVLPGVSITVVGDRFVREPELTITFRDCEVVDHLGQDGTDLDELVRPVIEQQPLFPSVAASMPRIYPKDYPVDWRDVGDDVEVVLTPDSFRPHSPWSTDDDDFVILARNPDAETVTAVWQLTEDGVDHVTRGELRIPLGERQDARELVAPFFPA